jgi:hypothetical protein
VRNLFNKENLSFYCYTGGFYFGWLSFIAKAEIVLFDLRNVFQAMSFLLLAASCLIVVMNYQRRIPKLPNTNFKFFGLLFFVGLMGLLAVPLFALAPGRFLGAALVDITVFLYIFGALSFCFFKPIQRDIFCVSFIPLVALGFYLVTFLDIKQVAAVADRRDAFEQTGNFMRYALVVALGAASVPVLMLSLMNPAKRWITYGLAMGPLFWLYTSLVYSKRQGLLEFAFFAIFLTLLLLFNREQRRKGLFLIALGFAAVVGGVIAYFQIPEVNILLSRVIDRFIMIQYEGLENLDRIHEIIYIYNQSSPFQLLFGRGFLSFDFAIPGYNNMHMGYANLVFKGGIFFLIFYLCVLASNIYVLLRRRTHPARMIALFFTLYMALQFAYAPLWGQVPSLFWVGLAVFSPEIFLVIGSQMQEGRRRRSGMTRPRIA